MRKSWSAAGETLGMGLARITITKEYAVNPVRSLSAAAAPMSRAVDPRGLMESAGGAGGLLKALANPDRLVILCQLAGGEKTVTELGELLRLRQPTLSQQLARLRADALVRTRRDGKHIYYALASTEATRVIELLYELFGAPAADPSEAGRGEHAAPGRAAAYRGNSGGE